MIAELGNFCLILAFALSLAQFGFVVAGHPRLLPGLARYSEGMSLAAAFAVLLSFLSLIYAFVTSDFSVENVYQHSHTDKPLLYKISGAWGSHEGSMLLWCTILLCYGALITLRGRGLPSGLKQKALGVQGLLGAAFVGFTLFSSNPLNRLDPAPFQGQSLNPALQDPALAFHPPMLYLGYVGFSVVFSFAVAALLEGRIDRAWARWVRPWVLLAWSFLTVGITLGAFWAYYELGWGGWWAWDPVENSSFMPWLAATALLHSAIVMEKRDALKAWTLFLSILAFTFSMMGAFLVRSGLLTSVHAFAIDPQRGILLVSILFLTAGAGFTLFGLRVPELAPGGLFAPISRESSLVVNNLLISAALTSVVLGTLYPLLTEALFNKTMSVGAPYFLTVFGPVMAAALLLVPVSSLMSWKRAELKGVLQRLGLAFAVTVACAALGLLVFRGLSLMSDVLFFIGLLLGFWLVWGALRTVWERVRAKTAGAVWRRFANLPLATHGMNLAHIGLGVFLLGAVVETHARVSTIQDIAAGQSMTTGAYVLHFDTTFERAGPNFDAAGAVFTITRGAHAVCTARPERRFYPASSEMLSKVALCFTPLDDLYVVLADPRRTPDGRDAYQVRFFYNPWVRLLFLGPVLMALGGALSLADRRLRLGVAMPARRLKKGPPEAAE
jgi:cytochrome c-type biogenesis protein CcmF